MWYNRHVHQTFTRTGPYWSKRKSGTFILITRRHVTQFRLQRRCQQHHDNSRSSERSGDVLSGSALPRITGASLTGTDFIPSPAASLWYCRERNCSSLSGKLQIQVLSVTAGGWWRADLKAHVVNTDCWQVDLRLTRNMNFRFNLES